MSWRCCLVWWLMRCVCKHALHLRHTGKWALRDYGVAGQLGLEPTPEQYLENMVEVFRLVRELLADDGTLWLNMGDSYYSPKVNGGVGENSTINSKRTQAAFRDAQRARRSQNQNPVSSHSGTANRRHGRPGLKPKDLVGMPWRLAFALQADGWYLRRDIIWHKPNPMPESCKDRPTTAHEYLFLLSKRKVYYYDYEAIKEPDLGTDHRRFNGLEPKKSHVPNAPDHQKLRSPEGRNGKGRNKRSVWTVPTQPYSGAHFATFPPKLIEPCILAGSRPGDVVLDPFFGSGTTGEVAERLGRQWIGIELNQEYEALQKKRTQQRGLSL